MLAAEARAAMRQERQAQANIAAQGAVVTKNSVLNDQGKHGLVLPVVVHGERGMVGVLVLASLVYLHVSACVRMCERGRESRRHAACMSRACRMHFACMWHACLIACRVHVWWRSRAAAEERDSGHERSKGQGGGREGYSARGARALFPCRVEPHQGP